MIVSKALFTASSLLSVVLGCPTHIIETLLWGKRLHNVPIASLISYVTLFWPSSLLSNHNLVTQHATGSNSKTGWRYEPKENVQFDLY